jgi:hypothetical protein
MKKGIKHLGLRIDPSIHRKLTYIAGYEGRSLNGQVYYLIQKCVREFEKEHGAIPAEELEQDGRA